MEKLLKARTSAKDGRDIIGNNKRDVCRMDSEYNYERIMDVVCLDII